MRKSKRCPQIITRCVADSYADRDEKIVEVSGQDGRGCLILFRDDGRNLTIHVYRREGVQVSTSSDNAR